MTAEQFQYLRNRQYSYAEMIGFGDYIKLHWTEGAIEKLLKDYVNYKPETGPRSEVADLLQKIESMVAEYYGIPIVDIRSKRRYAEFTTARFVIAYLSVKFCTQREVACALMDKRDNIMYRKKKCAILMSVETPFRNQVKYLEKKLADELIKGPEVEKIINPVEATV